MKYNGRALHLKIYRLGGLASIRKKIKIKNEQISRLVFAPSDKALA